MYWCAVCETEILSADAENRHSTPDGEDCHASCCSECAEKRFGFQKLSRYAPIN